MSDLHLEALRIAKHANATVAYKEALVPLLMTLEFFLLIAVLLFRALWLLIGFALVFVYHKIAKALKNDYKQMRGTAKQLNHSSAQVARAVMNCVHWCGAAGTKRVCACYELLLACVALARSRANRAGVAYVGVLY